MRVPIGFLIGVFLCALPVYLWMIADTLGLYEQFEAFLNWVGRKLGAE